MIRPTKFSFMVGSLVLAGAALLTSINTHAQQAPSPSNVPTCNTSNWALTGYRAILASPQDYDASGVHFFPGALAEVQARLPHPIYFIPGDRDGTTMCAGTHGSVTEIEVAINQHDGTQLRAIGVPSQ